MTKTFESWITGYARFKRLVGVSQLFIWREQSGRIIILTAKIKDSILMEGTVREMENMSETLTKRFKTSKVTVDDEVSFNGCSVRHDDTGSITIDMSGYVERVHQIPIDKE